MEENSKKRYVEKHPPDKKPKYVEKMTKETEPSTKK